MYTLKEEPLEVIDLNNTWEVNGFQMDIQIYQIY